MPIQTSTSPSPAARPPPSSSVFSSPPLVSTILHPPRPTSDSILRTRTSSRKMRSPSMRSSRNRRARSVTASSTDASNFSMDDYTFDLAKLGRKFGRSFAEKESEVKTPEKEKDEIGSEDDGPADFTINLGKWMRGTEGWRKDVEKVKDGITEGHRQGGREKRVPGIEDDSAEDGGDEDALSDQGVHQDLVDDSEFGPLSTQTSAGLEKRVDCPDHQDQAFNGNEHGLEMQSTPQLSTEERQDRAAEEVFEQISALQAEVERLRLEAENHQAEKYALEHQYDELAGDFDIMQTEMENQKRSKGYIEKILKEDKEANFKTKAAMQEKERPMTPSSKVGSLRARFEPKAQELSPSRSDSDLGKLTANARIQSLEAELKASQKDASNYRDDAEALRDAATSTTNKVLAECEAVKETTDATISILEKQLQAFKGEVATLNDQLEVDKNAHRSEMSSIRLELESCKQENSNQQRNADIQEQNYTTTLNNLKEQLRSTKASEFSLSTLKNELQHAEEQLAERRRIADAVEEENDRLTRTNSRQAKDLENAHTEHSSLSIELESKARELTEALTTIETLKSYIDTVRAEKATENPNTLSHDLTLQAERQAHQKASTDAETEHNAALATLRAKVLRAGEGMQKREERLAKAHQDEIESLRQRIADLVFPEPSPKSPPRSPHRNHTVELAKLRNAILLLSRTLESTQSSLSTAQASLTETRFSLAETLTSLSTTRQDLETANVESENIKEANAAVNKELEARFKTTIEKREREWRRRVELLLRERDRMANALMVGWGKEEMGVAEEGKRQGFRYRFVDRG